MKKRRGIRPGQALEWGTYEGAPLRWQVLEVDPQAGLALLILKRTPLATPLHGTLPYPGWEASQACAFLNSKFLEAAWTPQERQLLHPHPALKAAAPLFILDAEEVGRYFAKPSLARVELLPSAIAAGGYVDNEGCGCWWLRGPGRTPEEAPLVGFDGSRGYYKPATYAHVALRPALWVAYATLVRG